MRANPRVCVEVDEITTYDQWVSVVAFGRYEELPEAPGTGSARLPARVRPRQVGKAMPAGSADSGFRQYDDEREWAWQLLSTQPEWGIPGCTAWAARAHRDSAEPFIPVYYSIRIDRVTGHEATPDARDATAYAGLHPSAGRWSWLRALTRVFSGRS